jgi:hypothetical protein
MHLNAISTRAPPYVSTPENDAEMTREVEEPTAQRNHNRCKEYRNERPAVAATAPVSRNMQLSGLSEWHPSQPSIYPTTGFTGLSTVEQLNLLQILHGRDGYANTAVRGLVQTTSPSWDEWSSR